MSRKLPKLPSYPIWLALEELGITDAPHVTGSGYKKMLCPFHSERDPSASVSNFGFNCFSCGITGDALKLLVEKGGLTFADAKRRLDELNDGGSEPVLSERRWGNGLFS